MTYEYRKVDTFRISPLAQFFCLYVDLNINRPSTEHVNTRAGTVSNKVTLWRMYSYMEQNL
jgi:hypothetical protein